MDERTNKDIEANVVAEDVAGGASENLENRVVRDRLTSAVSANMLLQPANMIVTLASSAVIARLLGPELLAIVASITAVTTTVTSLLDFGILKSFAKIVPDIGVRFGQGSAIRIKRLLGAIKLRSVLLGLITLIALNFSGIWTSEYSLIDNPWFLPIVAAQAIIGTLVVIEQGAGGAAFQHRLIVRLTLFTSVSVFLISVGVVLVKKDPYLLAAVILIPQIMKYALLKKWVGYDLDAERTSEVRLSLRWLLKEYGSYMFVTYILFVFNRFVYGLPLSLILLAAFSASANAIGNAVIAMAIVRYSWDIANIPLASLRGPLLARLHAAQDPERFRRVEGVMVSIVVLGSVILAIGMLTLGPMLLDALFGVQYSRGIAWGTTASVIALFANVFTLGNGTLHQTNRFTAELLGTGLGATIIIGNAIFIAPLAMSNLPFVIIIGYVLGRATFWLFTDIWVDSTMVGWDSTWVKLRGLLAGSVAVSVVLMLGRPDVVGGTIALFSGLLVFIIVFRFLGGIGQRNRAIISDLISPRYRWAVSFA